MEEYNFLFFPFLFRSSNWQIENRNEERRKLHRSRVNVMFRVVCKREIGKMCSHVKCVSFMIGEFNEFNHTMK